MAYIPEDAEWYLAEIILEICVEDDPRNVVHINVVLIHATNPEEAYDKAMKRGKTEEQTYENQQGKSVVSIFKGLRDLLVIHDKLEDGAELSYKEQIGLTKEQVSSLITPKHQLGIFAPVEQIDKPDYAAGDIVAEVYERFPELKR
ncbi:DUF4288 domain-containing protein [Alloacidobacterium dinghuense]|uniref:DUF4288 domain-containing protein n=1 Tax=Alloacidobacterium dinghuense TaxID=2763107 RepID=A0A7G8BFA0_9BACT|nr:DUF4288 domain-containing protein [Alloacidobacterium dinghuense]QNI31220.1 DUF4288 domain-containing protein [Alloacidobacterium dinghuense]